MAEIIQAIYIRETETRQQPKPHTVYRVEVHAAVRNWVVWKRYSDFSKLHQRLTSIFPKNPPPAPLPGKRFFPSTFSDPAKIEERRRGLEDYLRGILSSRDDRWRQTDVWKEFLSIPTGRPLDPSALYTSETWLDEYNEMTNTARDIRSLINKRSTHVARNEISASHNCTVHAKKLLMTLSARLSNLEQGLGLLAGGVSYASEGQVMSDGELRRRQDMVSTLKDEKDALFVLVSTGRPEQDLLYSQAESAAISKRHAGDRKALLDSSTHSSSSEKEKDATTRATSHPNQQYQQQKRQSIQPRRGRAFGTAAAKNMVTETEQTRGLDNEGLMQHQQQIMADQDDQVEHFNAILARQKQLGIAIGDELETQNQVLDELDNDVGRTHTKLKFAKKKLGTIK
ncbi:hypothetical protein BCR43DRAFT_495129 [Syncephalastrum racemosum]|uniref:Phox homologous domain-containing protein n=1 Tax=Syncephalastrum racemosum TaxID=13706 RepID=A0A1X2H950_SYNRA|nr:hypothetical protein BCR43DRAFT_495129 [Syncephalastrum racemosum]